MTPSMQIDHLVASLADWRGETLARVRRTILAVDPEIAEEWKWMGSPVWSRGGIIAVGNAHKDKVKLTFPQGARLPDPHGVFNNGLGGGAWRSIDLHQGHPLAVEAFQTLVRDAVAFNLDKAAARKVAAKPSRQPPSTLR